MKDGIKPTEEQHNIVGQIKNTGKNIFVRAYAGTGKTKTLEMAYEAANERPTLYLVFSKSDQLAAEERLPFCEVRTVNGMGHRIFASSIGKKLVVDSFKCGNILSQYIRGMKGKDKDEANSSYWEILAAVAMAKHIGYIPNRGYEHAKRLATREQLFDRLDEVPSEIATKIIDDVLFTSIQAAYEGAIDFDDQIYMPSLFGGSFPRFPLVLVDEWQDLSPTNIALLERLCKDRVCGVGDRWQSIYYFRGAETAAVDKGIARFGMEEMPLSASFRCPRVIVEAARWRVPDFKWINDGGHYEKLSQLDPDKIPEGRYDDNKQQVGTAIICRNNAPLFRVAYSLLARKRSVQVAGSDIGPKIVRLLKKIGSDTDTQAQLLLKIDAWRDEKLQKSRAPANIHDTAECLKTFASWGNSLSQAIGYAESIFKFQGTITLTTGHKAKGKEWDVVYHLDPFLLNKEEQDLNLRYVITTRAKRELYEIKSEEIQW